MIEKLKNRRIKGLLPLFFLLIISACKKESSDIGVSLRPDGGSIDSETETFDLIMARSIEEDSLRTDSLSTNILGALNDPIFGSSRASLIIQPLIDELGEDYAGKIIDSVVLSLKFDKAQIIEGVEQVLLSGDQNASIEIEAYKLDDDLVTEDKYYSNFTPTLGSKIGTYNGTISFFDSIWVVTSGDSTLEAPELRFKLDNSFGQEMLDQAASVYSSKDEFLQYLKGIVLVPKIPTSGSGIVFGVEARNPDSKLQLFFNGSESSEFSLDPESERINLFEIVNQSADIVTQKTGSGSYVKTYVQSLTGAKVKVDIADLEKFIERGDKVVINEAKVEFGLDVSTISSEFSAPSRLLLLVPSAQDARNAAIIDFIDDAFPPNGWLGYTNYGGEYEPSENKYEFHFNRYLQKLVDDYIETGENNFRGFYISLPSDYPASPTRGVINSDPLGEGFKVSVSYTKLN